MQSIKKTVSKYTKPKFKTLFYKFNLKNVMLRTKLNKLKKIKVKLNDNRFKYKTFHNKGKQKRASCCSILQT